jgi:hypothetical protein
MSLPFVRPLAPMLRYLPELTEPRWRDDRVIASCACNRLGVTTLDALREVPCGM